MNFYASFFALQLFVLYLLSRQTLNELFRFLRLFFKDDKVVFTLVSLLFLPGTIIHEMSHFMMATVLFLKVREVHVFPSWEQNYIKLGRVVYEKKDVIRGIIVGISPVIIGLLLFWWLSVINALESDSLTLRLILIYLIFIISSTMFSSKQDLIDIIYLVPIFILGGILVYLFQIDLRSLFHQQVLLDSLSKFLYDVNIYLAVSLIIHVFIFAILRVVRYFLKG